MIKLLAVDMDGTCLDGRSRMTDRTLCALRKAAEKGVIIVPATGRQGLRMTMRIKGCFVT